LFKGFSSKFLFIPIFSIILFSTISLAISQTDELIPEAFAGGGPSWTHIYEADVAPTSDGFTAGDIVACNVGTGITGTGYFILDTGLTGHCKFQASPAPGFSGATGWTVEARLRVDQYDKFPWTESWYSLMQNVVSMSALTRD